MAIKFYEDKYYMLSNLSAHAVKFEGRLFPTSEHAYQASKFIDDKVVEEIRRAKSPLEAKVVAKSKLGTSAENPNWQSDKLLTMEKILKAKLDQHLEVKNAVISTGNAEIVEDSPVDSFWGCGKDGKGESHLGKLWMKIRKEL